MINRRKFITAAGATALTIGLAGCADQDSSQDAKQEDRGSGAGQGPHVDVDEAVNTQDGKTYIDLHLRTWFDCSGYVSLPDGPVTITVTVQALGDDLASKEWDVTYDDCMREQARDMSFTLNETYDEVLISVEHNWSGG